MNKNILTTNVNVTEIYGYMMSKNKCVVCCAKMSIFVNILALEGDGYLMGYFAHFSQTKNVHVYNMTTILEVMSSVCLFGLPERFLLVMQLVNAMHIPVNGKATSETESLLQDKHEV